MIDWAQLVIDPKTEPHITLKFRIDADTYESYRMIPVNHNVYKFVNIFKIIFDNDPNREYYLFFFRKGLRIYFTSDLRGYRTYDDYRVTSPLVVLKPAIDNLGMFGKMLIVDTGSYRERNLVFATPFDEKKILLFPLFKETKARKIYVYNTSTGDPVLIFRDKA